MNRLCAFVTVVAICICVSVAAWAGGPFTVDEIGSSGTPLAWINKTLTWSYDEGRLAPTVDNAEAVGWVRIAMDEWAASSIPDADGSWIATANVSHVEAGGVGVDIDVDNLETYLTEDSPVAAVLVFDEDGSIMEALGFDPESTLGLSQPLTVDASGLYITRGIVILNGKILDLLATKTGTGYTEEDLFRAALLHEVGHLYNLDHTQFNLDLAEDCELGGTCEGSSYIATIFPELKTYRQSTLSRDDMITLSWIYPNSAFESRFCTISGEIRDRAGKPLQGVNVIARRATGTQDPRIDVRTMVSGVMYPACSADGHYYLHGIIPGKAYQVIYEALSSQYTGASGFEPLPNPPSGFDSGTIGKDGATTVNCVEAGEEIVMDTVQIDVANPCSSLTAVGGSTATEESEDEEASGGSSGSGCSLAVVDGPHREAHALAAIMAGLGIVAVLRFRKHSRALWPR